MAEKQPAPLLPALNDAHKLELFRGALLQFLTHCPSHGPREPRDAPSRLSPTTRCAAWAVDAVKAAEYCWEGERTYRATPKTEASAGAEYAEGGASDVPW